MALMDLYDWDTVTSLLAAQAQFWKPGSASGYHGVTQGYLVGEVVRRVTGQEHSALLSSHRISICPPCHTFDDFNELLQGA